MLNTATLLAVFATLATVHAGTFHLLKDNVRYTQYAQACKNAGLQVAYLTENNVAEAFNAVNGKQFDAAWIQSYNHSEDGYSIFKIGGNGVPQTGSAAQLEDRDSIIARPLCYKPEDDNEVQDEKIAPKPKRGKTPKKSAPRYEVVEENSEEEEKEKEKNGDELIYSGAKNKYIKPLDDSIDEDGFHPEIKLTPKRNKKEEKKKAAKLEDSYDSNGNLKETKVEPKKSKKELKKEKKKRAVEEEVEVEGENADEDSQDSKGNHKQVKIAPKGSKRVRQVVEEEDSIDSQGRHREKKVSPKGKATLKKKGRKANEEEESESYGDKKVRPASTSASSTSDSSSSDSSDSSSSSSSS
jgi:hypothetical protein